MNSFVTAFVGAMLIGQSHGAVLEQTRGMVECIGLRSNVIKCAYALNYNAVDGIATLKINPIEQKSIESFELKLEGGEAIPESVKIESLNPVSGEFLFIYWSRGASAIWLTIIGVRVDGKIGIVAEYSCHGEIYVMNVLGNRSKQVVIVEDSYAAKEYVAEIHEYGGPGVMRLVNRMRGRSPHLFTFGPGK